MPITISSETSSPDSMTAFAFSPTGVPAFTAARSMSPVETWGIPRSSTSFAAWVPLPAPGGPSSTSRVAVIFRASPARAPSR